MPRPVATDPAASTAGGVPVPVKPVPAPKKETARLEPLPAGGGKLPPAPTLKLEKTQPLIPAAAPVPRVRPTGGLPGALPTAAAPPGVARAHDEDATEAGEPVPLLVSAGVFALALVTFLVQLWSFLRPD
jgi:hypothetical protein